MILQLYRIAWEPALVLLRVGAFLEKQAARLSMQGLWPASWRLADRLGENGIPAEDEDAGSVEDNVSAHPSVWMHAASLGECKGLWGFAQTLRGVDANLILTTNTVAGLEFLRAQISRSARMDAMAGAGVTGTAGGNSIRAEIAPFDHPRVVAHFLRRFRVRALVLFEVELWPHFVLQSRRANVPVLWISARLTARARRRYTVAGLFPGAARRVLRELAWTQAQTAGEAEALRRLGCDPVETGADLRGQHYLAVAGTEGQADTGAGVDSKPETEPALPSTIPREPRRGLAFVSFHADELPALRSMVGAAMLPIHIFPRKLHDLPAFYKTLAPLGFVLASSPAAARPESARVLVDSFGRVAETLARCRVAVIGGSFARENHTGGHNLWEPLLAGTRIVIGPHHANQEYLARALAKTGLLRIVSDPEAAAETLLEMLAQAGNDPEAEHAAFVLKQRTVLKHAAERARARLVEAVNPT